MTTIYIIEKNLDVKCNKKKCLDFGQDSTERYKLKNAVSPFYCQK